MSEFLSPVYNVQRVPVNKIRANEYNPNRVAPPEMKLLYESIKEDSYTMPIVCYYHKDDDVYEIVDGGSPPRMRERRIKSSPLSLCSRITPAYAGKT